MERFRCVSTAGEYLLRNKYLVDCFVIAYALLSLKLAYFSFFYNLVHPVLLNRSINAAQEDDTRFHSIDNLCYWNTIYIDAMGICVFLIWIKIFKFIGFNKTMLQFRTTLSRVSEDESTFRLSKSDKERITFVCRYQSVPKICLALL